MMLRKRTNGNTEIDKRQAKKITNVSEAAIATDRVRRLCSIIDKIHCKRRSTKQPIWLNWQTDSCCNTSTQAVCSPVNH